MIRVRDAGFYRQRAAEVRMQSQNAATEELRASYLAIAADWERLAEQIEDITDNRPRQTTSEAGDSA